MSDPLPLEVTRFLSEARIAHLATADADGQPTVVPVCFALEGSRIYSAIDAKPKRSAAKELRRVRDLRARPEVALVTDRWDEDWRRLGWVMIRGRADMIQPGAEHARALVLLRDKYPQYRAMALESAPMIRIAILEHRAWGDLGAPSPLGG